jgi:sugar phosphate permease
VLFSLTPVDATYLTEVMPATIFIGIGAGLGFPSLMMLAMLGATPEDSGLASGLINTSVQVGGAIGLAVLATLASERTGTLRADGESVNAALNGGYHLAYLIGAALVAVAIVVAATVLRSGSPAAAGQHAERTRAEPAYSDAT